MIRAHTSSSDPLQIRGQQSQLLTDIAPLEQIVASKSRELAGGSVFARKRHITDNPKSKEARLSAVIEIQRCWRGYSWRKKNSVILAPEPWPDKPSVKSLGRLHLERQFFDYLLEQKDLHTPDDEVMNLREFSSALVAGYMQPLSRVNVQKSRKSSVLNKRNAAVVIQRAWRKHIDTQVFKYYKELINFKSRGDPSLMLRCINPAEAKMLDAASGIHLRFRLAGDKFPPNIYYKIFTHRPVQDLCANSPKDYTMFGVKRKMAKDVHNKTKRVPVDTKEGWYKRIENNGWRMVSDRLIMNAMNDPLTYESSKKTVDFHHNRLQRKEEVRKKKKQKKIEWMKKMYKEGMLKARSTDPETKTLIDGASAGMVATADHEGYEALEEWEVDELLDWTTSLNFDDYLLGWKELATSSSSGARVDENLKLQANDLDPYAFTLSTAPTRPETQIYLSRPTTVDVNLTQS